MQQIYQWTAECFSPQLCSSFFSRKGKVLQHLGKADPGVLQSNTSDRQAEKRRYEAAGGGLSVKLRTLEKSTVHCLQGCFSSNLIEFCLVTSRLKMEIQFFNRWVQRLWGSAKPWDAAKQQQHTHKKPRDNFLPLLIFKKKEKQVRMIQTINQLLEIGIRVYLWESYPLFIFFYHLKTEENSEPQSGQPAHQKMFEIKSPAIKGRCNPRGHFWWQ